MNEHERLRQLRRIREAIEHSEREHSAEERARAEHELAQQPQPPQPELDLREPG